MLLVEFRMFCGRVFRKLWGVRKWFEYGVVGDVGVCKARVLLAFEASCL